MGARGSRLAAEDALPSISATGPSAPGERWGNGKRRGRPKPPSSLSPLEPPCAPRAGGDYPSHEPMEVTVRPHAAKSVSAPVASAATRSASSGETREATVERPEQCSRAKAGRALIVVL